MWKARENGHLAVIVTGRSRSHIEEPILDIGFDGIYTFEKMKPEFHRF